MTNRSGSACQGTAHTIAPGRSSSPRSRTHTGTRGAKGDRLRRAPVRTMPPLRSTNARAGTAYRSSSGTSGRPRAESRRFGAEHAANHLPERAGCRDVDRLVQRGHGQRLPEHLDETGGLALRVEPFPHGRCRPPDAGTVGAARPVTTRDAFAARRADRARPARSSRMTPATGGTGAGHGGHTSLRRACRFDRSRRSRGSPGGRTLDSAPMRRRNLNVSW